MDKTLVIMAAGLSSRYGSIKQIERVGPGGEMLMDYAVFDAVRAGFNRIIFILKPELLDDIRALYDERLGRLGGITVGYAVQTNDRFIGREKPLGTVHAVLCAKELIHSPFAVINADDYYGIEAFRKISRSLDALDGPGAASMAAYRLCNTVSRHGSVTRGICRIDGGLLRQVTETYNIRLLPDGSIVSILPDGSFRELEPDSAVSMNMWGLHNGIFPEMEKYFEGFLSSLDCHDLSSECLLPVMMDHFASSGSVKVSAMNVSEKWFGLTHREDRSGVADFLAQLHSEGVYPPALWI